MDDDSSSFGGAELGVGFAIDTAGLFESSAAIQAEIDRTERMALTSFAKTERASKGMLDFTGASAAIKAFGADVTRESMTSAKALQSVEKAGEAMVRRLESQGASYGKTREELRGMRAETAALAAEQKGMTELAGRIRAAEQAIWDKEFAASRRARAEAEAAAQAKEEAAARAVTAAAHEAEAVRLAANAHSAFEAAARRGMAVWREQEAAVERDSAALARLRAMIDPVAAAQDRLNAELIEARRVMTAAGASAQELSAAEDALIARASRASVTHDAMAASARKNGAALQTIALQLPDITQGLLTGQKPMTVFIQQGFQIVQVAQMSEGGLRGFGKEVVALSFRFAPLLVAMAAVGAGLALFNRWVNEGVTNDQLTRDLGSITGGADATKQELYKLKDATVSFGSTAQALFSVLGKDIATSFVGDMQKMGTDVKAVLDGMTSYGRAALAGLYAGVAGTKAYLGEVEKGGVLGIGKMLIGQGDPQLLQKTYGKSYEVVDKYLTSLGARVRKEAVNIERQKLAEKIGFNNLPKEKVDRHAEQLAREAEATEAQIRNLYALADAYGVSGAAALVAEVRVKAESAAIKGRADIEAAVERQIRLSIAQRVSDAAKGALATREQAQAQVEINGLVAAGAIPAERAAELLRDRIAELPLLAAIEVAQQRGLKVEADKATKALEAQRSAQEDARAAARGAMFVADDAAADRRLAELAEELRLVGATEAARSRALAIFRATQEAEAKYGKGTQFAADAVAKQTAIIDGTQRNADAQRNYNDQLTVTADRWDLIAGNIDAAGRGMADAFGDVGRAIGDVAAIYADFAADRARLDTAHAQRLREVAGNERATARENALFALRTNGQQISMYADMASAAKGFFKEGTAGYRAIAAAEKAFRVAQFAMSVASMVQNAAETLGFVTNAAARATADGTAGIAAQSKLPFPFNIVAMGATAAALVAAGVAIVGAIGGGSGQGQLPASNTGTGTVFGDGKAQSESIKRSIDQLREIDLLTNVYSRQMAASLKSIDSQIGGVAAQIVRAGDVSASAGVTEGFKRNLIGNVLGSIPLVGGLLGSLFGSTTTITGSGLFAGPQSVGQILGSGFDASYYSDIQKTSKFLGIKTGTKNSTQFTGADAGLESQFTLLLKSFSDAIGAAAGPLGIATRDIEARVNGFVVDLGKIDTKGLTGPEIQEKLAAVFGAAADGMAAAAVPGIQRWQKVGEGAFETLVRVASTVESVTTSLDLLGTAARSLGIDAKLGLADQFDSLGDLSSAIDTYFQGYYTKEEQAAAKTAQLARVFDTLGFAMPSSIAGFRQLVEAQDLTTKAGQAAYATLLQLAPAFADLQSAMDGAKSAADIAAERQDLQRQLLELQGNTAAVRAMDLAKLGSSNRALQEQIWAIQDAQEAAKKADELRQAWESVGDSIEEEIRRIRGLSSSSAGGSFAELQGRFNAATAAARGGDQDAAKSLPGLSQALLTSAGQFATSRQELLRIQAQTAASLETTNASIAKLVSNPAAGVSSTAAILASASTYQAAGSSTAANDQRAEEVAMLRDEIRSLRADINSGNAAIAGNTGKVARILDNVTGPNGGAAISTAAAA